MFFLYLQVLQSVRLFVSRRCHFPISSRKIKSSFEIEVLGTSYNGFGKAAIVRCRGRNTKAYLINCSENIPRVINYKRYKMAKIDNIFVTHSSWRNIGGIQIFLLRKRLNEIASGDFRSTTIHGTSETVNYVKQETQTAEESSILHRPFRDDNFEVRAMRFSPSVEDRQDIELLGSHGSTVSYHFKSLLTTDRRTSFMFIENPSIGHVRAMLTNEAFKQSLVVNPPKLVIHFTEGDLLGIVEHCQFMELFPAKCKHIFVDGANDAEAMHEVNKRQALLHYLGSRRIYPLLAHQASDEFAVDTSKVYQILSDQDWEKLTKRLINLIKQDMISFGAQNQLQPLDPPSVVKEFLARLKLEGMENCMSAVPMLSMGFSWRGDLLEPSLNSLVPSSLTTLLALDLARQQLSNIDRTRALQQSILDTVEQLQRDGKLPSVMTEYPRMVFLGTGATSGNLSRNCSGLLLRLSEGESILLDCGDGVMSRLLTLYGKEVGKVLLSIRYIFISHLHRDHFTGLPLILQLRKYHALKTGLQVPDVCIVGNETLVTYLSKIDVSLGIGCVPEFEFRALPDDRDIEDSMTFCLQELGIEVMAVPVIHSVRSFGFVLRHHSGWKIVYSGDTMPSKRLVEEGHSCDLLIHEATLDDCHPDRAVSTMHSTTDDAIKVGLDMAAKHVILTHFTQGYRLERHLDQAPDQVSFASDFMQVTLDDLHYLRHLKKIIPLLMVDQSLIPDQDE